jgi:hypothetical protein
MAGEGAPGAGGGRGRAVRGARKLAPRAPRVGRGPPLKRILPIPTCPFQPIPNPQGSRRRCCQCREQLVLTAPEANQPSIAIRQRDGPALNVAAAREGCHEPAVELGVEPGALERGILFLHRCWVAGQSCTPHRFQWPLRRALGVGARLNVASASCAGRVGPRTLRLPARRFHSLEHRPRTALQWCRLYLWLSCV